MTEYEIAVQKASKDRLFLAHLVKRGLVMRTGEKALPLPSIINLAIKPKKRKKKR